MPHPSDTVARRVCMVVKEALQEAIVLNNVPEKCDRGC
jgi:hypothetical protein